MENWIDKLIEYISPETAYRRASFRYGIRSFYDNGASSRANSAWNPLDQNGELGTMQQRQRILARARDLERNSDIANSIINSYIRLSVGSGYNFQSQITDKNDVIDNLLNTKLEADFKIWSKKKN